MRKVLLIAGVIAVFGVSNTFAFRTEKLNLKGGVIVEGHIQSQVLGKSVTFSVERTYATVRSAWIVDRTIEKIDTNILSNSWKEWVEEQKSPFLIPKDQESIYLSKIEFADRKTMRSNPSAWSKDSLKMTLLSSLFDGNSHQVYLFEEGGYFRFVDLTPKVTKFNMSDIYSIEYKERDKMALNGIVDVVELNTVSGTSYKGQIIEKVLGELTRIKTDDGIIHSILNSEIRCIKKERLNPNTPILNQAQFLDEVNGIRGLIICQNTSSAKPFIQILDENENQKQFDTKEITTIKSIENKCYSPIHDIVIKGQEVYFNRHEAMPVAYSKKKDYYNVIEDSLANIPKLNLDSIDGELVVEMANMPGNTRVSLLPVTNFRVKGKKNYYIPNDIFADGYVSDSSQSVSPNNTLRITYKVERGLYALYVSDKKKFYYCEVK